MDIHHKFCAMPGSISRTVQQLKKCWQNVKIKTKKTIAEEKKERKVTGGGIAEVPDDSDGTGKVASMIADQINPLPNAFDNDTEMHDIDGKESLNTLLLLNHCSFMTVNMHHLSLAHKEITKIIATGTCVMNVYV